MALEKRLERADIMAMADYAAQRDRRRREALPLKAARRVAVGPHVTLYFESYATMWLQVHEMLYAEKGGEAQIAGELEAYNPLIPQGRELVATMMIEIEDPVRRDAALLDLVGIERAVAITVGRSRIGARPTDDVERVSSAGRTSSVHFLRFPFDDAAVAAFRAPGARAAVAIDHPRYGHSAVITEASRVALAEDFD